MIAALFVETNGCYFNLPSGFRDLLIALAGTEVWK